jgi:predicted nucleic acid-binding protein
MPVTLTDTGPLVALINRNDPNHLRCLTATRGLADNRMTTTWPCFTEAMYLLHRAGGHRGQSALWGLIHAELLELHDSSVEECQRMSQLMELYRDQPMDLADASIMAAAERLGVKRLFTLDGDFRVYRLVDGSVLEIVP